MKEEQKIHGITLIALVVTIVVLLILAGVSISMLTGENGIITQAKKAKDMTEQAEQDEITSLKKVEEIINGKEEENIPKVEDPNPGTMEGSGTNSDPFVINSIEDLVAFSNSVNSGTTYSGNIIQLARTLDFKSDNSYMNPQTTQFGDVNNDGKIEGLKTELSKGEGFTPIGNYNSDPVPFAGTFEGNNNAIRNLYENFSRDGEEVDAGLFGLVTGTVSNLYVLNCNIIVLASFSATGTIVGNLGGNIYRCMSSGDISVQAQMINDVGGIAGFADMEHPNVTIEESYNFTNVNVTNTLIAETIGFTDKSTTYWVSYTGGIIGQMYSKQQKILNCYNFGNVKNIVNESGTAGGIVGSIGYFEGTKTFNGDIVSQIDVGGYIENCYSIGNINLKKLETNEEITDGEGSAIGVCGGGVTVQNVYGINSISVIGSVEENQNYLTTLTNVEEKTAAELKKDDMLNLLGNKFQKDTGINQGYPILSWQK